VSGKYQCISNEEYRGCDMLLGALLPEEKRLDRLGKGLKF